ncbi:MAG: LTA synthase family protein [Eubacteriales bacterium]|nr:LTA synthase family protein [Eubacteriales bacterium]
MKVIKYMFGAEPFPNTKLGRSAGFLWTALVLLAASICVGIISLYFGAVKFGYPMFQTYFHVWGLAALNILPISLLTFLFWFMFGRAGLSLAIPTAVAISFNIINILKIRLRNDPFMMEDIKLASEAGGIAGEYNLSLSVENWLGIAAAVGIVLVTMIITRKCKLRRKEGWGRLRLVGSIVFAAVVVLLWKFVYLNDNVYAATINNEAGINHMSNVDEFQSRGFVYPFLHSYKEAIDPAPEGYDEKAAAAVLAEYEDADIPEDKKVNVISVMLEAYTDLSRLVDNQVVAEVYAPLHEIEAQSVSGNLVSNVFAGGTNQTERSFLTGYSHLGSFRTPSNSYVRYFTSQGYTAEGSHPGYEWFYNRSNINENLGFENYYFLENYYCNTPVNQDTLIRDSDAVFFTEVVNMMQRSISETGKPYFSFHVSYQNHGPYDTETLFRPEEIYVTPDSTGWSQESCTILNNYLAGLADTTKQIQQMLDTLNTYEEPVVFVAFGDHLPWLGDDNSVYTETGMNIDEGTTEGYLNHYSTPYFIWANEAAKQVLDNDFVGDGGYLSPNFLMNELFDLCGWTGDAYMQYTQTVRAVSPVTAENGSYLLENEMTKTPPADAAEVFQQFQYVQNYRRKNFEEQK